jgi:hypothetical protein
MAGARAGRAAVPSFIGRCAIARASPERPAAASRRPPSTESSFPPGASRRSGIPCPCTCSRMASARSAKTLPRRAAVRDRHARRAWDGARRGSRRVAGDGWALRPPRCDALRRGPRGGFLAVLARPGRKQAVRGGRGLPRSHRLRTRAGPGARAWPMDRREPSPALVPQAGGMPGRGQSARVLQESRRPAGCSWTRRPS